jgi:hypothetical protein
MECDGHVEKPVWIQNTAGYDKRGWKCGKPDYCLYDEMKSTKHCIDK